MAAKTAGGYYLTVWRRGVDGQWTVVLNNDVGMSAAIFEGPSPTVTVISTDPQVRPDQGQGLREADSALDADLSNGPSPAFASRLEGRVLVVRSDHAVAIGRRRALRLISDCPPILEAQLLNAGVSSDGVLGYTYGKARWPGSGGEQTGYYVRIWRNAGQGWRLLADQMAER
jgi:hypothetical protein